MEHHNNQSAEVQRMRIVFSIDEKDKEILEKYMKHFPGMKRTHIYALCFMHGIVEMSKILKTGKSK